MSKQINKLTGEVVKSTSVKGGWTTIKYVDGKTEKMRNGAVAGVIVAMADVNDADAAPASKGKKEAKEPKVTRVATPKKKKEEGDVSYIRRVKSATYDVRDYDRVKSAGGNSSLDSGDVIAVNLRGKSLDEVYDIASTQMGVDVKALYKQYGRLNPGMQRMVLGNRIRGFIKRGN